MVFQFSERLKRINILTYLVFLAFIVIAALTLLIFYINQSNKNSIIHPEVTEKVKNIMNNPTTKKYLTQLNNRNLSKEERYKALVNLVIYFRGGYIQTRNSYIRNYIQTDLNKFAKDNFPNQYLEGDFILPCSDPQCGHEITPEFTDIIEIIEKAGLPEYQTEVILSNLKTVAYKPIEDKFNSITGLTIVIEQLEEGANSNASEAARLLKSYLKKTYSVDYSSVEPE